VKGTVMTAVRIERIVCDNPECVIYVDELVVEFPDEYSLDEHVKSIATKDGWACIGDSHFCPAHGREDGLNSGA
jgi:hypothetical protein